MRKVCVLSKQVVDGRSEEWSTGVNRKCIQEKDLRRYAVIPLRENINLRNVAQAKVRRLKQMKQTVGLCEKKHCG